MEKKLSARTREEGKRCILLRRRRFLAVYLGSRKEEEEEEMPRGGKGVEKREGKKRSPFPEKKGTEFPFPSLLLFFGVE